MIAVRLRVQCRPEKADGRDVTDPNAFVAVEVFEDRAALDRQEALDEVQRTIGLLGDLVAAPPEATIYHVSSSEPWGG